ncbi:uridine kinase [Amycolatopsis sp.]|uniref:uridine kinase family protein n=1 Tax=Amycolatopsis sp. TaxID=37632 RepID=UPI002E089638|nr:uridine kinase [Amycolatopsis sp.]
MLAAEPRLGRVRLLAIDGPSGSGKSTLAAAVITELRDRDVLSALVRTDEFATWEHPVSWWPRLVEGVLEPLRAGRPGRYRRMDWTTGSPQLGALVTVEVPDVLVLEGVSSGRSSVRPLLSCLCWLEGPDQAVRLERAVARDGESSRGPLRAWQAFERGWFAADKTGQPAVSEG